MDREAICVVGAGYGDEGKGLKTDYWVGECANPAVDAICVRFNGGAQAGHTVVGENGQRHVFSHMGAGTLRGTPTYLSPWFVCNPGILYWEHRRLRRAGLTPLVFVHADCPVTTPYDVYWNRHQERQRGAGRHGSCGVGFGDTIERHGDVPLRCADLLNATALAERLREIRYWYVARAAFLSTAGVGDGSLAPALTQGDAALAAFHDHVRYFLAHTAIVGSGHFLKRFDRIVMEGAQGLLLDMDGGAFPHVTRSYTGVRNALAILDELGEARPLTVDYVTRAYTTRHGAGPLPGEEGMPDYVVDPTNRPNPFQGGLRHAPLDLDGTLARMEADFSLAAQGGRQVRRAITMTCLDQLPGRVPLWSRGVRREIPRADFLRLAGECCDYLGFGPQATALRRVG
jgi:adenylosuccinate synthase